MIKFGNFNKRGQSESLSFLTGLILFIVFASIIIAFLKMFWIEKDCFGLLNGAIDRAISEPGRDVTFDCHFKNPIAIFGKEDSFAYRILPLSKDEAAWAVLKPDNEECKDKSCVCKCDNFKKMRSGMGFPGKIRKMPLVGPEQYLETFDNYECYQPLCMGFDENLISSCSVAPKQNPLAGYVTPSISCPFGLGGSFLFKPVGGFIDLIDVNVRHDKSLGLVQIVMGEERGLNFRDIGKSYENIISDLKADQSLGAQAKLKMLLEGNVKVPFFFTTVSNSLTKILPGNMPSRLPGGTYFYFSSVNGLALLIDDKGMHLVMPVFVFEDDEIIYKRTVNIASTDLVKPCYNGVDRNMLLITGREVINNKNEIGVYVIKRDPFVKTLVGPVGKAIDKSPAELFDFTVKGFINKENNKLLNYLNKLEFRKEKDDKFCLYGGGFGSEIDITDLRL